VLFLVYAYIGPSLPAPWTHRGYDLERIIGHMYTTLEGVFGVPIDVCSTIIAGFCIFNAFLTVSGAGKFYVDFAFASMGQKPTADGRWPGGDRHLLFPGHGLRLGGGQHGGVRRPQIRT
jgi:TRAP-type uncharacterized transport system fused permease subunit